MTKFCPHCGAEIPADTAFCPKCGAKQLASTPATPQPATQTSTNTQPVAPTQPGPQAPPTPQSQAAPDLRAAMAKAAAAKAKPGDPDWVPYNQYPEHGFANGWRVAFADMFNFKQAVGRANYWWGMLYVLVLTAATLSVGGPIGLYLPVLVMLGLTARRMWDMMINPTLRAVLLVLYFIAWGSSMFPPFSVTVEVIIILYVGLSKTDWRSPAERPVAPLA